MKNKFKHFYEFWIKSSRGTDQIIIYGYSEEPDREIIKSDLETWAATFGAYHTSENYVQFGFKKLAKVPKNQRELSSLYKRTSEQLRKAKRKNEIARQLLNIMKFETRKN